MRVSGGHLDSSTAHLETRQLWRIYTRNFKQTGAYLSRMNTHGVYTAAVISSRKREDTKPV